MAFLTHSLGISLSFDGSRVDWVLLRTRRVLADPPTHAIVDLGTEVSGARYDDVFEKLSRRLERLAVNDDFRDDVLVLPETSAPFAAWAFVRTMLASRLARRAQPSARIRPVELSNKTESVETAGWRTYVSRRNVFGAVAFAFGRKAVDIPKHPLSPTLRADLDRLRTKRPTEEDEAGLGLALALPLWYRESEASGRSGGVITANYTA